MFKKAKRANFRRRNESDEEEPEEGRSVPPISSGPAVEEIPFMETSISVTAAPISSDNFHSNGFPANVNTFRAIKKEKKVKDTPIIAATVPGPTKASLLSFDDDEDESEVFRVKKPTHSKKIVKQLKKEYKEDLEKSGVKQEHKSDAPFQPVVSIKEEVTSRAGSEQGEEEMEVDSTDEQQEEAKSHGRSPMRHLSTLPESAGNRPENRGGNRLCGVKNKTQRQKIAEEIGIEGSDDEALDTGQDEESSRWEQEQIRKGISIPQVQSSQPDDNAVYYQNSYETQPYGSSYSMPFTYSTVVQQPKPTGRADNGSVHYGTPISDLTPISIDLVKKRLQDRLSQMSVGHDANARRNKQIEEDLAASESAIEQLEGSSNNNSNQYKFLQEMRGYVGDLLECFSEKVPAVLELEAAMHQLLRQRASRLVQRRQDDIKDESSEFASLSNKAVMAPNLDSFRSRPRSIPREQPSEEDSRKRSTTNSAATS
ncbi:PAX3- and PAX7-binding protein 1 [Dissostichus eleginoides]|uniref:PAX3- and PAX7-binding protein 1 n=1 Tax=Dissostichus eleginoides TaxID=100907 RepID=A0AAD9EYW0_DISEL|nr:PAX3- and PAX7-binding protein 1 [Dissostichus eleginoides]